MESLTGKSLEMTKAPRFTPVDPARPATDQIAAALRAAILSMALVPGQRLSENDVGRMFEASRTPVREAFARLREDGLIEVRPSRGSFVSKLSEAGVRSAQFLREALEAATVERLCRSGLPGATRSQVADCLARQAQAITEEDKAAFQREDDRFHRLLAQATGFDRVGAVLAREKTALDRLRCLSLNEADHMGRLLSDHRQILEAIEAQDAEAALVHLRRHLRGVLDVLSQLVDSNRDYFDAGSA